MTKEVRTLLIIGAVVAAIFAVLIAASRYKDSQAPTQTEALIRPDSHSQGPSDAKVTIVEFGDYQCPACFAAQPTIERILDEYEGKIRFVYRHFPLPQHKNALLASKVAEAAAKQGKFWEMHTLLYQEQQTWAESDDALSIFLGYAKQLGLEDSAFMRDVSEEGKDVTQTVRRDQEDGSVVGVNSTPSFFINGEKLSGAPSYQDLKSRIDTALGATR
jgi:protein-disulfide isomerase